jgi:hypothetical protein
LAPASRLFMAAFEARRRPLFNGYANFCLGCLGEIFGCYISSSLHSLAGEFGFRLTEMLTYAWVAWKIFLDSTSAIFFAAVKWKHRHSFEEDATSNCIAWGGAFLAPVSRLFMALVGGRHWPPFN